MQVLQPIGAFPIALLVFGFCLLINCCTPSPTKENENTDATDTEADSATHALQMEENASYRLNQYGDSVLALGNYSQAMQLYQQSLDSAAASADSFAYYDTKLDIACTYDRLNELNTSIEIGEEVLQAFIRSGDSLRIGRTYSTLSVFYSRNKNRAKALETALKGFDIIKTQGSFINRCAAYNQMAFTYSDAGDWPTALPLLDSALMFMKASGYLDQLAIMYVNLGDCYKHLGRLEEAKRYMIQAEAITDSLQQKHIQARALEHLSDIAVKEGQYREALTLFKQSKALKDSIFKEENVQELHDLEVRYQTKEKQLEIDLLKAEKKAGRNRRKLIFLFWSFLSALSLFLLVNWRLKLIRARKTLGERQRQLNEFARMLLDKNSQLGTLETAPPDMQQQDETVALAMAEINEVSDSDGYEHFLYNSRILTDSDWEIFKSYFEKGNPGYLMRLRRAYPKLSGAEERLLLLIKLNFNTHEIASTLGISKDSVKKGRQRLRKRLELNSEDDLEEFIHSF